MASFGLTFIYPEDKFYKTHKTSKADFLLKLKEAESDEARESLINALFDDSAKYGRRGVLSLKKTKEIIE